ncbi:MAG: GNAT family N-acetyltransferase [Asgard group archaeon]|nr:GNAT family N-acetyltransferase [Asgard group archaeon]
MKQLDKSKYLLEQFTLQKAGFKPLSKLITEAFLHDEAAKKEGASIRFTEETFNVIFGAPSINNNLFVRVKSQKSREIVGFMGMIPKTLKIQEKHYQFVIPAWLSVHPEHQKKGLARAMGKKIFQLALEEQFDGGYALHESDQHGYDVSRSVAKELNVTLERIMQMNHFIIRVFDSHALNKVVKLKWYESLFFKTKERIPKTAKENIRAYNKTDFPEIYDLFQQLGEKNEVAVIQQEKDIEWLLDNPQVLCFVHLDTENNINGCVFAWEFLLAGFGKTVPFGWLDCVHIGNLTKNEGFQLVNHLCQTAYQKGWKGLQTPYIPYFPAKPLKKANFVFFPKTMSLDIFNLTNIRLPQNAQKAYFDWR